MIRPISEVVLGHHPGKVLEKTRSSVSLKWRYVSVTVSQITGKSTVCSTHCSKLHTSNGSWCMGIKGEMSGTVCVTFTWWVVYSFCLFCWLFIIVTTQFVALYKPCKPPPPSPPLPPPPPSPPPPPRTTTILRPDRAKATNMPSTCKYRPFR